MAVEDRIDLVAAAGGLVHTLGKHRDSFRAGAPEIDETRQILGREASRFGRICSGRFQWPRDASFQGRELIKVVLSTSASNQPARQCLNQCLTWITPA